MQACGPAMQLSPMGAEKARAAAQQSAQQAAPPPEEDPPKIRVIVRKRPINTKVREVGSVRSS